MSPHLLCSIQLGVNSNPRHTYSLYLYVGITYLYSGHWLLLLQSVLGGDCIIGDLFVSDGWGVFVTAHYSVPVPAPPVRVQPHVCPDDISSRDKQDDTHRQIGIHVSGVTLWLINWAYRSSVSWINSIIACSNPSWAADLTFSIFRLTQYCNNTDDYGIFRSPSLRWVTPELVLMCRYIGHYVSGGDGRGPGRHSFGRTEGSKDQTRLTREPPVLEMHLNPLNFHRAYWTFMGY